MCNDWSDSPFELLKNCPRFETCSAPICPLDPDWRIRYMCRDEPTCYYLREYAKHPSNANLDGVPTEQMASLVVQCYQEVMASSGPLRRGLERAARKPSGKQRNSHLLQYKEVTSENQ